MVVVLLLLLLVVEYCYYNCYVQCLACIYNEPKYKAFRMRLEFRLLDFDWNISEYGRHPWCGFGFIHNYRPGCIDFSTYK